MLISNIPSLDSMSMVRAKVDLYDGPTLVKTCTCGDVLSDFVVTREGDNSKFFGFGICHKFDVNFIDIYRELTVVKGNTAEIGLGDGGELWDAPYPTFYFTEIKRDEKTNTITGTAYDKLYWAGEYLFKDLDLEAPYNLVQVAQAIADKLGLALYIETNVYEDFLIDYAEGANLDGTEPLRAVLNWIAEATQTIYYVNNLNRLVFKRLVRDGEAVEHITRDDYYELNTKTPRTLTTICNTTELGDNIEASLDIDGAIQYIRNNPFYELRTDLNSLIDKALTNISGITITQFDCSWIGNYLLEIGDKIALETETGEEVYSYLLSDTVEFAGTLNESSEWEYTDEQPETYANPTNIGERINQTFAKVDKVNKEIALVASEVSENREEIGSLKVTTDSISSEVGRVEDLTEVNSTAISSVKQTADELTAGLEKVDQKADLNKENTDAELLTLRSKIDVKLDTSSFGIELNEALTQGVDQLTVKNRNFNFGYDGLTISDDHADISTNVDIDGLSVMQRSNEVLKAGAIYDTNGNRTIGVTTANLHAKTYLWVGDNSRFEDYVNGTRTGCFWVG